MGCMVSVVTVCFNAQKSIEKTIQSVLSQTFSDFEYVVKDGGSLDDTNSIVLGYKKEFENRQVPIKHIISADQGIYDAMNQAVSYCEGEWIIFMNAGDCFYDDKVLSDIFERECWNDADIIYGHTFMKISEKYAIIINHDIKHLDREWSMNHQSLFERRRILVEYPFVKNYKIVADYDHLLRIKNTCAFKRCNTIISIMDRDGISNQQVALRNKENALLYRNYGLNNKRKNRIVSIIKENVKRVFPNLEIFFYAKNSMKRTRSYIEKDKSIIK